MTKFTLLAAASVAALTFAGAAQAGVVSGSVNGVATGVPAVVGPPAVPASGIYTIASERTDASIATPAAGFIATNTLTNPLVITANTTQNYRVTFTVTNGTIAASSLSARNGAAAAANTTVAAAGTTANSATFIVTVNAGVAAETITGFQLTTTLTSPSELAVSVASTTELLAGGVASTVDNTAATTLVRYAPVIGAFSATSNNVLAALPDFKSFTNAGVASNPAPVTLTGPVTGLRAELASNFGFANAGGTFYAGLADASVVTANSIISGGTLTITGGQLNVLTPTIGGVTTAPVTSATNAVFTLTESEAETVAAGTSDFFLTQTATAANQVAIAAGSYTTSVALTYAPGYTAPTTVASAASGNINLDGVNFIAPWVGGSQAPGQTVVRLSNGGAAVSGTVTLRLNNAQARAAGVTTGPGAAIANQTCSTAFTIPATGELQITGATLSTCFGAFLRGDLQITVQSASSALTAKARNVSADGTVFEQSLGRFSGATAAGAAF